MPEPLAAMRKVTFHTGVLPNGTHATFTQEGQQWHAWPADKLIAHQVATDKLVGALQSIKREAIAMINEFQADAKRVARVLEIAKRADEAARNGALEKTEARVS